MNSDDLLTGRAGGRLNQVKGKKEVLGSLRRSFRRKNKDTAFKKCDDDFATFLTHSASSTPLSARKKTTSVIIPDNGSNSFSSTGCLSNDSDTGNSVSHSPSSGKGQVVSESEEPVVMTGTSEQKEKEVVSTDDTNVVS